MRKYLLLALLAATPVTGSAELTIDELIAQSGVREGTAAMRDMPRWRKEGVIVIRDIGLDKATLEALTANAIVVSSYDEALRHASEAGAIIGYCDDLLLNAAPKLVWVQITSAGAERCTPVPKVATGEVVLTNMQKMSSPMIGEHAVAMALALARNLPGFSRAMSDGRWMQTRQAVVGMHSLVGKRLLVVGLGGIGTETARIAAGLGMRVKGTRNRSRLGPPFVEYVGLADELLELTAEADVVVNALPLTDATRELMDAEFFETMKPGALFINVGRGGTVVTEDLLEALNNGHLGGAGLDVTDPEPLPQDHPLWRHDRVIITPHVSSAGADRERHRVLVLENLRRYVAGEKLLNVVDPERGY